MNKTALITGASSGIGKEFAKLHAKKGGDLIIIARSEGKLNQLKEELENKYNSNVKVIVKDLTLSDAPKDIYNEIKSENIKIDYLINNAGFGGQGKFHERDWEQDLSMIKLNIIALSALTRLFLPDFVKRKSGKILNVSSTASLLPGPMQAVYFASKAYVTSFSNAISEELKNTGVTVTALLPGATDTKFAKTADLEDTLLFKKAYSPSSVAKAGYNGMLKGKLNVLAGVPFLLKIGMKLTPFVPKKILLPMVKKMQEKH